MEQKYEYDDRPEFNINGYEFLEGDIVIVDTYDSEQYHGRIDSIFGWAFSGNQGMAITIIDENGELIDLDDVEIRDMKWT